VSRPQRSTRSLVSRVVGRIRRLVLGDRVLVPRHVTDPMWHLASARSRIRGGEIVVRFDNIDADIRLDARSDLALRALGCGSYEPDLMAALAVVAGDGDAINVGANVGIVSIALQRVMPPNARLMCVEPIAECVERLRANLDAAGIRDALVVRAFATAEPVGARTMWTVPGRPEYSSGGPLVHPSVRDVEHVTTSVPVIRLDDEVVRHGLRPSVIVLDCEGGESAALAGATQTLRSHRPAIIAEHDPALLAANGSDAAAMLAFLGGLGYRCLTLESQPRAVDAEFRGTLVAVSAAEAAATADAIAARLADPKVTVGR